MVFQISGNPRLVTSGGIIVLHPELASNPGLPSNRYMKMKDFRSAGDTRSPRPVPPSSQTMYRDFLDLNDLTLESVSRIVASQSLYG